MVAPHVTRVVTPTTKLVWSVLPTGTDTLQRNVYITDVEYTRVWQVERYLNTCHVDLVGNVQPLTPGMICKTAKEV